MSSKRSPRSRGRWRLALANAALGVGGLLVALIAAELAARLTWKPLAAPPAPTIPKEWRNLRPIGTNLEAIQPNLQALFTGVPYRTNSSGFRGPEVAREKPRGVFRIAVIGDSISMGWGVVEEDTYAARIGRELGRRDPEVTYEVLNLGLPGQDTAAAIDRFHELGVGFDPDLVVYGFTLNDLENDRYQGSRTDLELDLRTQQTLPTRWALWRVLRPRYHAIAEVLWAPDWSYVHQLDQNYFHNPPVWEVVHAALDRLAATTRERDVCVAVLLHTRLHFLNRLHPYHRHYDAIVEAVEEREFFPIRSVDAFLGRKDRELWVGPDDPHPGADAHGILADTLLRGLVALPERCWKRAVAVRAGG